MMWQAIALRWDWTALEARVSRRSIASLSLYCLLTSGFFSWCLQVRVSPAILSAGLSLYKLPHHQQETQMSFGWRALYFTNTPTGYCGWLVIFRKTKRKKLKRNVYWGDNLSGTLRTVRKGSQWEIWLLPDRWLTVSPYCRSEPQPHSPRRLLVTTFPPSPTILLNSTVEAWTLVSYHSCPRSPFSSFSAIASLGQSLPAQPAWKPSSPHLCVASEGASTNALLSSWYAFPSSSNNAPDFSV